VHRYASSAFDNVLLALLLYKTTFGHCCSRSCDCCRPKQPFTALQRPQLLLLQKQLLLFAIQLPSIDALQLKPWPPLLLSACLQPSCPTRRPAAVLPSADCTACCCLSPLLYISLPCRTWL
jgi:hypothetical protein